MFSIKRRILTAVGLTASLVAMAVGQQSAPRSASKARPPGSATAVPAAQLSSRTVLAPAAAQSTSTHAASAVPPIPNPQSAGAALVPVAIASEPSTAQAPTPARTSSTHAPRLAAMASTPGLTPQFATPMAAPTLSQAPSIATRVPNPQSAVPPAARAVSEARQFQRQSASTPRAMVAPVAPLEQATSESQTQPRPSTAQASTAQAPAAGQRSPDYVEEKGFKGRVFEIKHRDPDSLGQVLRPLGSGFKGATISANREFRILTVRDFPENIAAMEEAIKRLDTPEARSPDIEFTVHIIIASTGEGGGGEFPSDLGPVLKQLQSTLRYKTYNLMTSAIHRGKEGPVRVENSGIAESKLLGVTTPQGYPIFFNYSLQRISLDGTATSATVQVGDFNFRMRTPLVMSSGGQIQYENIGFNTPVSVREGEKVVVGTTSMGDKGLIVVLSAKVLK